MKRKKMVYADIHKKAILTAALLVLVIILGAAACSIIGGSKNDDAKDAASEQAEDPVTISILCVGDVMAHSPNIKAALSAGGGSSYDFTDNYEYVKSYIESADLALCNVETTFAGGTPQGYPLFCAPDELAYAIMYAGFDVAMTSNNHMMDTGFDGMQRTIEVLRNQGLTTVGSRYEGEKTWSMIEKNGLKIGLVAYTYETTGADSDSVSVNGNYVSKEAAELINSFNYNELDSDLERIGDDISDAKEAGADIILCYMHWGNEYQLEPDENQITMASTLADMGADVIFASHPHVVQRADVITSADGRNVPVFYSMGNFISNQRTETLSGVSNSRFTEAGIMAQVNISILKSTGQITDESVKIVPTWVDRYGDPLSYRIIPLDSDLSSNATLAVSGHASRAAQALEDVTSIIGSEYIEGKVLSPASRGSDEKSGSTSESESQTQAAA